MIKYVFRDRPVTLKGADKANPQRIGEALTKIRRETEGKCNSKVVLDRARDKSNYLHRFFEWRDGVAAEKYRQVQAQELMSCVDIIEREGKKDEKRLPAFVSLNGKGGRSYHTIGDVLGSAELQVIALKQAEADFESYARRLMAFADICGAIKEVTRLIKRRREEYEERRPPI
jgi:hypothetical protein